MKSHLCFSSGLNFIIDQHQMRLFQDKFQTVEIFSLWTEYYYVFQTQIKRDLVSDDPGIHLLQGGKKSVSFRMRTNGY